MAKHFWGILTLLTIYLYKYLLGECKKKISYYGIERMQKQVSKLHLNNEFSFSSLKEEQCLKFDVTIPKDDADF